MSAKPRSTPIRSHAEIGDRRFFAINGVLSAATITFLVWILVLHESSTEEGALAFLPALNAALNATVVGLLLSGVMAIKRGKRSLHRVLMLMAGVASAVFLVSYVTYHYAHGDTPYTGEGPLRAIYFAVLISHIMLSTSLVPLAISAYYFALKGRLVTHKRVTRVLTPIWLYVSATGVVIFFMLR